MSRRKTKVILLSEMAVFDTVVKELVARGDFNGFDFSTLTLNAKSSIVPTIRPENLKKAIVNIERHIAINCKDKLDHIVGLNSLSKITKISRPTITRWVCDGLIYSELRDVKLSSDATCFYDLTTILEQLKTLATKK